MKANLPTTLRRAPAAFLALASLCALAGCVTNPVSYDYTAFRQANPKSILVLPPVNESVDTKATHSVLAQSSKPLAEAGYYVLPVALVEETFQENGLTVPDEMHAVELTKLHEIFGADAVLYMKIKRYGATYFVVGSATVVEAEGKLVDSKSGTLLWEGSATASSQEGNNNSGGGIAGILLTAIIQQVISEVTDQSHGIAGIASERLLSVRQGNGMLPGPRHPSHSKGM
jgi:hypothetical protein